MIWKIFWVAALALFSASAKAEYRPGRYLYEGCIAMDASLAGRSPDNNKIMLFAAECMGSVQTLIDLDPWLQTKYRFCVPPNTDRQKILTTVVRYLQAHTADLDKPFTVLAVVALQKAWPCRD